MGQNKEAEFLSKVQDGESCLPVSWKVLPASACSEMLSSCPPGRRLILALSLNQLFSEPEWVILSPCPEPSLLMAHSPCKQFLDSSHVWAGLVTISVHQFLRFFFFFLVVCLAFVVLTAEFLLVNPRPGLGCPTYKQTDWRLTSGFSRFATIKITGNPPYCIPHSSQNINVFRSLANRVLEYHLLYKRTRKGWEDETAIL